MTLHAALISAGLTPPASLPPGRWVRFPGVNKNRANRAGWCKVISPTLAVYGDFSLGLSAVWRDESHQDNEQTRRLLAEARERERRMAAQQAARATEAAREALRMIGKASPGPHPYLASKGFPTSVGLVLDGRLLIPMRSVADYAQVLSVQRIDADGEKRFLPGGRTREAVFRIGSHRADRTVLCEGYATGLSLDAALSRMGRVHQVVVCFSAANLQLVAKRYPGAIVAADNDASQTGQRAAEATGLPWVMPSEPGSDFNDLHQRAGLPAVMAKLREVLH